MKVLWTTCIVFFVTTQGGSVFGAQYDYDVSVRSGSITFSDQLYAGEQVRVYGNLVNIGNKDIRGIVAFYQGPIQLGDVQPFSLKALSAPEDFWIDWRPSEGTYNVSMKVISTEPVDQNEVNNMSVTPLFTVIKRPPPPPPPPVQSLPVATQQQVSQDQNKQSVTKMADTKSVVDVRPKVTRIQEGKSVKVETEPKKAVIRDILKQMPAVKVGQEVDGDEEFDYTNQIASQTEVAVIKDEDFREERTPIQKNGLPTPFLIIGALAVLSLTAGVVFAYLGKEKS